ncbi:aldo/keto reductase [Burkholderia multivorans]|uniref:aldo/keto reductase n=1 Tax=Burkholderia anthina TaxID=179879 RepID=UPI00158AB78D|nr:aldo/keto reductase [Burkholderia anthina]MDN8007027.1 aldo/keto reductase [Burkholderia multivorans]
MKYRTLGPSGMVVSTLGLGTMYFGDETAEPDAFAILDAFIEGGGNLIDTADVYVGGVAEQVVGRWLKDRPNDITDRVVLATKGRGGTGPDVNDVGLSRRHLKRALDASCRRLGVDTIDLYQLHAWDPLTPVEETLSFLDDAVRAGRILYVGLSNFTGWQLQLMISTARAMGVVIPVSLQQQYSLLSRESEWEVIPAALHNEVGLLPWSPLAGGFLTGKYQRGSIPAPNTRAGSSKPLYQWVSAEYAESDHNWSTVDTVVQIANDLGTTPAQVALSWLSDRPGVTAPIIGARTLEHLKDALGGCDLVLDERATAALEQVSMPHPGGYPYGAFGVGQRKRLVDSSAHGLVSVVSGGSAYPLGFR